MTEYTNNFGPVDILPYRDVDYFRRVQMDVVDAYLNSVDPNPYWVVASTMQYRPDGVPHDLDVREVKVLSSETMASEDGSASVTLEVKG
ncbi:hypothetical protein ELI15_14105 [Rhizobium ruizarguesonis]|uniref:hypothetical protein n=1 Tax=Rhizobium ruizarguesonis TaxID=2081791 RepID=UPI00102F4BA9|nr:hypothetical protein [Rhizobium ruizarguesonis]TAW65423.1 hypothetical protein ELI15_14105 [Rhizobium ruizarguesonis]